MFCRSNAWSPDDGIPNLDGRIILVTGGYSGLGLETVRQLAKHNPARIYVAGRSEERASAAIQKLKEAGTKTDLRFLPMDLNSFESVKSAVESFQRTESRLDLLINNAGIMFVPPGLTRDGYEVQFGTNFMSHALLTQLLLPILRSTAKANPDVRVVSVSSASEAYSGKKTYPFNDFKTTMENENTTTRYCLSKLAQVHYSAAAARQYPDVKFITIHPGTVRTNLANNLDVSIFLLAFMYAWVIFVAVRAEVGALNQLWAAASPDALSGEFYSPVGLPGKGSRISQNEELREQLWRWTQEELQRYM